MSKNYGEMFQNYYDMILKYPSISRDEIDEMLKDSKTGDLDLIDKIVNNYLKIVISVAWRYDSKIDASNIMSVIYCGNLALTNAIKDYDESKGKFDKFLVSRINHDLREFFKKNESNALESEKISKEEVDKDILIILKDKMDNKLFYVFYSVLDGKDFRDIAHKLGVEEIRVKQLYAESLVIYHKYKDDAKDLLEMSKREGKKKNKIRVKPIDIDSIISYLYLQNVLTNEEARLYYYQYFYRYEYEVSELCKIMKLTRFKFIDLSNSLKEKIRTYLSTKEFLTYKEEMQLKYGDFLFEIVDINEIKKVNYSEIKKISDSLTLEQIKEMLGENITFLNADEISLLNRFFGDTEEVYIDQEKVEMDVNLRRFGFNRSNHRINPRRLYDDFLKYREEFSDEQALFLECYYFKIKDRYTFKKEFPDSVLYYRYDYLISRLERLHYGIYKILENNFNKDKYLIVKEKYGNRFTPEKIAVLDLFYGVGGRRYSIAEIVKMYGYNYTRGHDLISDARDSCISLYSNRGNRLEIDKKLYIPFLDNKYEYTPETREILHMYLVLESSYDEISAKTGLSKYRISNIITDGIRKIDGYRFGLFKPFEITKDEFEGTLKTYSNSFDELGKNILRDKFLYRMENKDIAVKYKNQMTKDDTDKKVLLEVNKIISKFYKLLFKYRISDVAINEDDVRLEINKHVSESVLSDTEKLILSFMYGIPYPGNEMGETLTPAMIADRMNMTLNASRHYYYSGVDNVKASKKGILCPDLLFISRDELDKLLDDKHLPISDKEKMIICHLFELKGFEYKDLSSVSEMLGEGIGSVRRRYCRAIVSIKKYLNGEIEAKLDYEEDIVPLLKYFSLGDRKLIEDYYKDHVTYEKMGKKYNISFESMVNIMSRIKINLFDLMDDPDARKFDFDYYMQVKDDRNLPFYGNLSLAVQIFDFFFGMNDVVRLSIPEIAKRLDLNFKTTTINNCVNSLLLAVCKLRDGIVREKEYTFEEIEAYYNKHSKEMRSTHRVYYDRYFYRMTKKRELNGIQSKVSEYITYDLLKEENSNCFKLATSNREEALAMLRDNVRMPIKTDTKKALMCYFGIRYRDIMSGKEINHVYRIIDSLVKQGILVLENKEDIKKLQKS